MERKKKKVFSLIVISLVGLNLLVFLFVFILRPEKKEHGPAYDKFIIESLHFNEKQIAIYEKEIIHHKFLGRKKEDLLFLQKSKLYDELKKTIIDSSTTNALINDINLTQKELEQIHFNHFIKIKSICDQKQLIEFNRITSEFPYFFHNLPRKKN